MAEKPNILLITSDQHRGDTLGCGGHPCVRTPHLDRLAYSGIRFTRAYSDCPVCMPARTTLITGLQAHRFGITRNSRSRIERDEARFLGSLIASEGYQTALVGKTHWLTPSGFDAGFEMQHLLDRIRQDRKEGIGRVTSRLSGIGANELHPSTTQFPPHLYEANMIVDKSIEFLQNREQSKPFFLWASFNDPHPPNDIHEPYYSMYDASPIPDPYIPEWLDTDEEPIETFEHRVSWNPGPMQPDELRKARAVYYGKITNMDHQLARLLGTLMRTFEWKNTWVIYTTDHGEHLGDRHDVGKTSFYEGSSNIPLIIRPPLELDIEPGQVNNSLVQLADILPTLCGMAGVEPPDDIQGKDLLPLMKGAEIKVRDCLHGKFGETQHMFHDGRYKYLYFTSNGCEQLFDLENDPGEMRNLATSDSENCARLRKGLTEHLAAENSGDVVAGRLVNLGSERVPYHIARSRNTAGWKGST